MGTNSLTIVDNRTGKQFELPIETAQSKLSIYDKSRLLTMTLV